MKRLCPYEDFVSLPGKIRRAHSPKAKTEFSRGRIEICRVRGSVQNGFTLLETIMAIAVTGMLFAGIVKAFIVHSAHYKKQLVIVGLRQNLRIAMNILSRDIRMAGFLVNLDRNVNFHYYDWDPRRPGADALMPFLHALNDLNGIPRHRPQTDGIVIVKASTDRRNLMPGEIAPANGNRIEAAHLNLNAADGADLNDSGKRWGVLIKKDLSSAFLFSINQIDAQGASVAVPFPENFAEGDILARIDLIVYRVDNANETFSSSVLSRKNAGNGDRFEVVAENVSDLQCTYILSDGSELPNPDGLEHLIVAVNVMLQGEVGLSAGKKMREQLSALVMIRNAAGSS